MTRLEKATLLSGDGWWRTHGLPLLGVPPITVADGPHGLRKVTGMALDGSLPATCFPTASALAATWNVELAREVGSALGKEAQACDVQILLGPGVNLKRSPLGGRNFEYLSEDPLLAGELASAFVRGVQAEGVGTSVKHFAANNQEFERMGTSSDVDERTLRELYLAVFERVVTRAAPWTVMTAYNLINGTYASEHAGLLTQILRKEWKFEGFVVSDWGAIDDRVAALLAGTNLEMPGTGEYGKGKILAALEHGTLAESALDRAVTELVAVVLKASELRKPGAHCDHESQHRLARRVAGEAIVLLKNDDTILPLAKAQRVAVLGAFARAPRYQGAGSSQVNVTRIENAYDGLRALLGAENVTYAACYDAEGETTEALLEAGCRLAREADVALVFAGLPDSYESEGFDRTALGLPAGHDSVIEAVAAAQPNVVVVLMNGSAVTMPWASRVKAILEAWLGGQAGGGAIADVLTGRVNPSGKLAETFPAALEQTPAFPNFPGQHGHAVYGEGVFIGYRHYDKKRLEPLFPFGFGLSYTTFVYTALQVPATHDLGAEGCAVSVRLRNTGHVPGKEVVQLYVREVNPTLPRPLRELRAFDKVAVAPGEEVTVRFTLTWRDFAFFDPETRAFRVNAGAFEILVGGSSRDLPLTTTVEITKGTGALPPLTRRSLLKHFRDHPQGGAIYREVVSALGFDYLLGAGRPPREGATPEELALERTSDATMLAMINDLPFGKVPAVTAGAFPDAHIDALLEQLTQPEG